MPTIATESLSPTPSAYVELFEIDCSAIAGMGTTYYFTTNQTSVLFGGTTYYPFPIHLSGIDISSDGAPARPTIEIANISNSAGTLMKFVGSLAFLHEDLIGAKVNYIRTFANYLGLSTRLSGPPLQYFIAKKNSHNKSSIVFELRNPLDKERAYLPKRQMLKRDFPGLGINKRTN